LYRKQQQSYTDPLLLPLHISVDVSADILFVIF